MLKSELLAPSGDYLAAYSALLAGADAIYLGGKNFSARMASNNFDDEELHKIVVLAHLLGKKVYVTMNTLLYQDEFMNAYDYCKFLASIKVDALIIQDLGLAYYLHQRLPFLPLHASTQLSCHNIEEARALKKIGFVRIVLAREAPLSLIDEIHSLGMEVEVFVHGALCVSFSGLCYLSSFIGKRSGNRGRCAQPCRMEYSLVDENDIDYGKKYFLSMKDLMTIDHLKEILSYKVESLKIEGRLKSKEYVYLVTSSYRHALDEIEKDVVNNNKIADRENLVKIFSRSFTKGFLLNASPLQTLNQNSPSHNGVKCGTIINAYNNKISILLSRSLRMHDGVRIIARNHQKGFLITSMYLNNELVKEGKKGDVITIKNIDNAALYRDGEVYLTLDKNLIDDTDRKINQKIKVPLNVNAYFYIGKKAILEIDAENGLIVEGDIVEESKKNITDEDLIKNQLKKSSLYPFYFSVSVYGDKNIYLSLPSLNKLRNQALELYQDFLYQKEVIIEKRYSPKCVVPYQNSDLRIINLSKEKLTCKYKVYTDEDDYHLRIDDKIVLKNGDIYHQPLLNNHSIASMYLNCVNSYALDALYSLGFGEVILSSELSFSSIKDVIEDYFKRNKVKPNVSYLCYGYLDMMIMKSCPIATFFKMKKTHCQLCHQKKYYLLDRMKEKFYLCGDKDCYTHVYNSLPINLIDESDELKELCVNIFYLFINKEEFSILDYKKMTTESSRGHFFKRPL